MDLHKIESDLRNRIFRPLYLFDGEEPYYIDRLVGIAEREVLSEAEKGFNLSVFYGRDADPQAVVEAARRYPMLAEHQVVLLKEAQQMKGMDALLPYLEKPSPSTLLVVAYKYGKLPKNGKLYKAFAKNGVAFRSEKIRDYKVAQWIQERIAETPYRISPKAAQLLEQYLGADLSKIEGELNKLFLNLEPGASIDAPEIERYIGISKDYNIFELHSAILAGDQGKAWRITEHFRANTKAHPLQMITASLYGLFTKLYLMHFLGERSDREIASSLRVNPYFIKEYKGALGRYNVPRIERVFAHLLHYDLRSKGVQDGGTPSEELLRELVWTLIH